MAVIGPSGSPIVAVPPLVTPTFDPNTPPTVLTAEEFLAQSESVQLAYIDKFGGSTLPKTVVISGSLPSRAFYIDTTGAGPHLGIRPDNWTKAPSAITAAEIQAWNDVDAVAYIKLYGSAGRLVLPDAALPPNRSAFSTSLDGLRAFREPAGFDQIFAAPPTKSTFASWTADQKMVYIARNGAGSPQTVYMLPIPPQAYYLDPGVGGIPTLGVRPSNWISTSGPISLAAFTKSQPTSNPDTTVWTDDDRIAFLKLSGNPIAGGYSATFSGGETALLLNGQLSIVSAGFGGGNASETEFLSWPLAARIAYVEVNGTGSPKTVALGTARYYLTPIENGTNTVARRPDNFNTSPTTLRYESFVNKSATDDTVPVTDPDLIWSERDRLDYVAANKNANQVVVLQSLSGPIVIMMSADNKKLYYLNDLQKRDIAAMPAADQTRFIAFLNADAAANPSLGIKASFQAQGLSFVGDTAADGGLTATQLIETALADFDRDYPAGGGSLLPGSTAHGDDATRFNEERAVFREQLGLLQADINRQSVYSTSAISDRISAITERAKRWGAFWPIQPERTGTLPSSGTSYTQGVASVYLSSAQLVESRRNLIKQEKLILREEKERDAIVLSGTYNGKDLDVPTLVFLMQQSYNKKVEAQVAADTEELNLINDLLKSYSVFQNIINDISGTFSSKATDDPEKKGPSNFTSYSALEQRALIMFDSGAFGITKYFHPIERLVLSSNRDQWGLYADLPSVAGGLYTGTQESTYWTNVANSLNNTVTTLNQESQTQMNDINSEDKQKNRHFDLANGALSKMAEMIQSIGRNVA